jgi:hypothetical protein
LIALSKKAARLQGGMKMTVNVTLKMPETLYQRVQDVASAVQRDVTEVLLDTLTRSFLLFYADQDRESMEQEVAAFEAMHKELWAKYPHQYVALHQGQIVDSDHDQMALLHRLDDEYGDEVVLVRQVLRQPQRELRYRSPRFVPDVR